MKKVNLGCGPYKSTGWINIDNNPNWEPEIVRDLTKGLPFDNDSIDLIAAYHFLEHLNKDDMLFVLEECYRVLKSECQLLIKIPIMDFDIDHLQIFDKDSLDVLYRPGEMRTYYNINMEWELLSKEFVEVSKGGNSVDTITYKIKVVK